MAEPSAGTRDAQIEFSRVVAFSDGVFAIAITLLVLTLDVPEDAHDLGRKLLDQEGDFFAYVLSFAVLGRLWLVHHSFVASLERFDSTLMGVNVFYLAWIALVPFSSELLGDYSGEVDAVIVYALNMIGVSLAFTWQLVHAARHGLLKRDAVDYVRQVGVATNVAVAVVFLISIPVAFLSTTAATLSWILIFFTGRRIGARVRRG